MTNPIPLDRDQRLIERIEALMASPPEGSVVLEITPTVARHVIQFWRGTHNRHEKPQAIDRYCDDMLAGLWHLNGSTVVFTDRHLLGDGQNRMLACIRADRPFKTHVVFGVPHQFFHSMDQGRVRTPGDLLYIEGVKSSDKVAKAVRWCELIDTGTVTRRTVFTQPEILTLYREKHKAVEDWLIEAQAVYRHRRQPHAMVMAALYHFDKKDPELAADFAAAWAGALYEARFEAINRMERELEIMRRSADGRVHEVVRLAMIINAWNAVREGRKGRGIRWELGTIKGFPPIE